MTQHIAYNFQPSSGFIIHGANICRGGLTLRSGQLRKTVDCKDGMLRIFRLRNWVVKISQNQVMACCLTTQGLDEIEIRFTAEVKNVMISVGSMTDDGQAFDRLRSVNANAQGVTVTGVAPERPPATPLQHISTPPVTPRSTPVPVPTPQPASSPAPAAANRQAEIDALRQQLNTATQRTSAETKRANELETKLTASEAKLLDAQAKNLELTRQLNAARQALTGFKQYEELSNSNADIRTLLEVLQGQIATEQAEQQRLKGAQNVAQAELATHQQANAMLEKQFHHLQQAQLDAAIAVSEISELDVQACQQRLAEMRLQLLSDEDTLKVLQQDGQVGSSSAKKNLEECNRLLELTEEKISAIIHLREKIEETIWQVVNTGENGGTISSAAEAGES